MLTLRVNTGVPRPLIPAPGESPPAACCAEPAAAGPLVVGCPAEPWFLRPLNVELLARVRWMKFGKKLDRGEEGLVIGLCCCCCSAPREEGVP